MAGLVPAIHVFRLFRHWKERSDEAIQFLLCGFLDCFASLAMTERNGVAKRLTNPGVVPAQAGTHT
ncbi:MAG: hypothetical protein WBA37_11775, partial [Xanthobacteraceae bacterium]